MSKYKAGDKFIIEIEDVLHIESDKGLWVEPWYIVNGMEGTYFEDDDLDSLERYDGDKGVWNAGYKTGDDDSPWDIAKALIDATTIVGDKELPAFDFDDLETIARLLQAYVNIQRQYIYGEDGA